MKKHFLINLILIIKLSIFPAYSFSFSSFNFTLTNSCDVLNKFFYSQFDYTNENSDQIYVSGSNNMLKHLNDKVFDGWTLGSEYITSILHNSFVSNLVVLVKAHSTNNPTVHASSSYIKWVNIHITDASFSHEEITAIVAKAKEKSINMLKKLLATNNPNNISFYDTSTRPVPQITTEEFKMLKEKILRKYQSIENFINDLNINYGVGLSLTDIDAYHAAKLSSTAEQNQGKPIFFDILKLKEHLQLLIQMQNMLQWLFDKKTDQQLLKIFIELRKNINLPPQKWDPEFTDLLQSLATEHNITINQEILHIIRQYIKNLTLLDYLPPDSLPNTERLKSEFDNFSNADYVLFIDMRNIGARNLLVLHKSVKSLLDTILLLQHKLETLEQTQNSDSNNVLIAEIVNAYKHILNIRKNILMETANYMDSIKTILSQTLQRFCTSYIIWNSGDDIFIKIKLKPNITTNMLNVAIKLHPDLKNNIRLAFINTTNNPSLTLEQSRNYLANATSYLKISEALDLDVIAESHLTHYTLLEYNPKEQKFEPLPPIIQAMISMRANSINH